MSLRFYFDEHMARDVAEGVFRRGHEVVMAIDVGMVQKDDATEHLRYATENQMVMVTFDRPFAGRAMSLTDHAGVICLSENVRRSIGAMVRTLARFADEHTADDIAGRVFWLP